jgi:hypothetical protein
LEPGKVTGDGNCLFQSISKVITGSEDDHLLFKLAMVIHGCSNEQYYQKNIHVCNNSTKMDQRWHDALLVYRLVVLVCVLILILMFLIMYCLPKRFNRMHIYFYRFQNSI